MEKCKSNTTQPKTANYNSRGLHVADVASVAPHADTTTSTSRHKLLLSCWVKRYSPLFFQTSQDGRIHLCWSHKIVSLFRQMSNMKTCLSWAPRSTEIGEKWLPAVSGSNLTSQCSCVSCECMKSVIDICTCFFVFCFFKEGWLLQPHSPALCRLGNALRRRYMISQSKYANLAPLTCQAKGKISGDR